jgi:hypothetical protein
MEPVCPYRTVFCRLGRVSIGFNSSRHGLNKPAQLCRSRAPRTRNRNTGWTARVGKRADIEHFDDATGAGKTQDLEARHAGEAQQASMDLS